MMCKDPQHCPDCGAEGNKLMSASSVIFKGSGFYSTDYRDSGYLEAKKKDGSGSPKPVDSKPETPTSPAAPDSSSPSKPADAPASSSSAPTTPTPVKAAPTAQAA